MGMFGSAAPAAFNPSAIAPQDRLILAGAMMRDAGSGLRGGEGGAVMGTMGYLAQRQLMNGMLGALNGSDGSQGAPVGGDGGASAAPPAAGAGGGGSSRLLNVLALINPEAAKALIDARKLGETYVGPDGVIRGKYDAGTIGQRVASPAAVNNTIVDVTDPGNVNRVVASPPVPGAQPVYDNLGRVVDWTLPKGTRDAIALQQAPQILRGQAAMIEAGAASRNAGTSAGHLADDVSRNAALPPPGFSVRTRRR